MDAVVELMPGVDSGFCPVGERFSGLKRALRACAATAAQHLGDAIAEHRASAPVGDAPGTGAEEENVDYEDVAKKLIVYSRSLAKGSLSTVRGASMGEEPVLQYLSKIEGGVAPSEIAKRLGYSRARMSHILNSLEKKGYIERVPDANDRRRVIVWITVEGKERAQEKGDASAKALAKQLEALGESDASELVRILNKAYSITYDQDDYLNNL